MSSQLAYYLLIITYFVAFIAKFSLAICLRPYRQQYVAKRIVWLPIGMSIRVACLTLIMLLFVTPETFRTQTFIYASIAESPLIGVVVYLFGVFKGWWNGIERH